MEQAIHAKIFTTNTMVKISLLAVIASLLMVFDTPLPIFPAFLKIDISDLPAVIGAMTLGPVPGVCIQLIKVILRLFFKPTTSMYVGEFANFLIGAAFVFPLGIVFRKRKNIKGFMLAALLGTVSLVAVGCLVNYFLLIPMYINLYFKGDVQKIISMSQAVIPAIKDIKTIILFAIAPFNLFKGIFISVMSYSIYKPIEALVHKQ